MAEIRWCGTSSVYYLAGPVPKRLRDIDLDVWEYIVEINGEKNYSILRRGEKVEVGRAKARNLRTALELAQKYENKLEAPEEQQEPWVASSWDDDDDEA